MKGEKKSMINGISKKMNKKKFNFKGKVRVEQIDDEDKQVGWSIGDD